MKSQQTLGTVLIVLLTAVVCGGLPGQELASGSTKTSGMRKLDRCRAAVLHYEREDIPESEILELFKELAQDGDIRGTMWIARFNDLGRLSLPVQPDVSQKMAKEAIKGVMVLAEKGDPESQFLIGAAYQRGLAVEMNLTNAVTWYAKAAAAGQITAINNLAYLLSQGHGLEPDIVKARYLFARAAELGSVAATRNLLLYREPERDDAERLKELRSLPLLHALGMKKDEAITFLVSKSLIGDPKAYESDEYRGLKRFRFRADGIVLSEDLNGRITNVEGHSKGSIGTNQFRGEMPLGLTWKTDGNGVIKLLGQPDADRGYVKSDEAYGFAYQIDNLIFVALTDYGDNHGLKLFRVHEQWACKYRD